MSGRDRRISTLADNGNAPGAAATLYVGEVMHARLNPFSHRFSYRVFSILIDLDRLDEVGRLSPLLSVNRWNLLAFHDRDHAEPDDGTARAYADRLLAEAGLGERAARILLLSFPRVLGYVFNPLSVYFAYDEAGDLVAVIYGVRNTFGERHSYVAPVRAGELSEAGLRQERRKRFHVSPFIGMDARYRFHLMPPGESVRLRIHEMEAGRPLLSATLIGRARDISTGSLSACLLKIPFMTWKIIAAIHWQALKLWLKGARFRRSPPVAASRSSTEAPPLVEPGE